MNDPKFLTVAEIAAQLRVSKMTVYRLIRQGAIGAIQVGHNFRVPEAAYQAYLAAGACEAPAEPAEGNEP